MTSSATLPPPGLTPEKPSRIEYVDIARGIFLTWMITAHSLGQVGVPADDWLWRLRPNGWATTCFIMLSGLSIAVVFLNPRRDFRRVRDRLYARGLEVVVIAFLSNLVFRSIKFLIEGTFSGQRLVDILLFREPWSLSAVLLPVVVVLFLSPALIRLQRRVPPWTLLIGMTLVNLLVGLLGRFPPGSWEGSLLYQISFRNPNPLAFYPLADFTALGLWTFSLGVLLHRKILTPRAWRIIMPACIVILLGDYFLPELLPSFLGFLMRGNNFLISLGIALAIAHFDGFRGLAGILGLLGRSSLLVFVMHRPFIQVQVLLGDGWLEPRFMGVACMVLTWLACLGLCWSREHSPELSRRLKRIGF